MWRYELKSNEIASVLFRNVIAQGLDCDLSLNVLDTRPFTVVEDPK